MSVISFLNIQGLTFNKIDILNSYFAEFKCDVFCIAEHFITSHDSLNSVNLLDFKLASAFCRPTRIHGGVAIFVRDGIQFKTLDLANYCREVYCDLSGVTIPSLKLIILNLYRSCLVPSDVLIDTLETVLHDLFIVFKNFRFVVVGDFNIRFDRNSSELNNLIEITESFGLIKNFSEPT